MTAPSDEESRTIGFEREEMFSGALPGSTDSFQVHAFVAFGDPNNWVSKLERSPETPLHQIFKQLMITSGGTKPKDVAVTAVPATEDLAEGDMILFPDRIKIKNASQRVDQVTEILTSQDRTERLAQLDDTEPLDSGAYIMVCSHGARDARCGYCGPRIIAALEEANKSRNENVKVFPCSHFGGHRYAGNAIVIRDDSSVTCDWLGYLTDSSDDAQYILDLASGKQEFPTITTWRGRQGYKKDEHVALCKACSSRDGQDTRVPLGKTPSHHQPSGPVENDAVPPSVLFVLGGPGSGKGTQCSLISDYFDFKHLSAGQLLRDEQAKPDSANGQLIDSCIRAGKIVPQKVTTNLLLQAMYSSKQQNFLVDGFPRNEDNLKGWQNTVGPKATVLGCLYIDCPEQEMERRLIERGRTSGRSDDNLESIRKRFHTFENDTMPIIRHFEEKHQCFRVNADRPAPQVFADVHRVLSDRLGMQSRKPLDAAPKLPSRIRPMAVALALGSGCAFMAYSN